MKIARTSILLLAVLISLSSFGHILVDAPSAARTVRIPLPGGRKVIVEALTPDAFRITACDLPSQSAPSPESSLLEPVSQPDFSLSTSDLGTHLAISSPTGLLAVVDKSTGAVTVSAGSNIVSDNGLRTLSDGRRSLSLSVTGSGSFYGAGERGHSFNLRGDSLVVFNRQNYGYTKGDPRISQMNITMPLFLSTDGYAILFDDFAASEMILSDPIVYTTESPAPVSWVFVNGGGTLPGVSKALSDVVGRQKLPPFWSLGYITSKYGYRDQRETLGVIDTLRTQGYPVDGIVLDLYWYGKEEDMGRLDWDPDQWPDHKAMLRQLADDNVNLVAISQPYVLRNGRGLENFNDLSSRGMLALDSLGATHDVTIWVGEGGMLDVSNPDTRAWLSDRYRSLTDEGVTGWWGDLGEPEVHPETIFHRNGLTARQYHNRYGNDWSRIISDLFESNYPDRRLMTLMRGGTIGLQRYSVFPWSTDVSRSWGGLQPQVTIMLNSGLSGLGYMSHDVGGFAIDEDNPVDPELYVRWLQLGLFSPVLRTHAQQVAEPYKYPDQQDIILPLIRERYAWLPYNYSLAYLNATQGLPLVRPLGYYSPDPSLYDDIDDEYLWGPDILVAPVMTQGATSRTIIFPAGTDRWIDRSDPSTVFAPGDTVHSYPAPLSVLPLFVREGAFIPRADYPMTSVADYDPSRYTVDYYPLPGSRSSFTMFDDNRLDPSSIEKGEYRLITFEGDELPDGSSLSLNVSSAGSYPGAPDLTSVTLVIHGISSAPASVTVDGRRVHARFNARPSTLTLPLSLRPDSTVKVNVNLRK